MDLSKLDPEMLMHIPVHPPPPGVTSNFIDPLSRAYQTRIAIGVMLALMVPLLFLRLYTRLRVTKTFGLDDCMSFQPDMNVQYLPP